MKKRNKQGYDEITNDLRWQPKGSLERQIIYENSKENFTILDVLETEHDIYLIRMDESVDRNELVRIDLKKKRLESIKAFSTDINLPNQLYQAVAIPGGIFIYTSNYHESKQSLWFIADKTRELKLLKEVESITGRLRVWRNTCYFSISKGIDVFRQSELWMSQGTLETTRLIKQGVSMSYY